MAFWGTRVLEIVKKHDSGGLLWKRIKLTPTRKANAKKRILRVWQVYLLFISVCVSSSLGYIYNMQTLLHLVFVKFLVSVYAYIHNI